MNDLFKIKGEDISNAVVSLIEIVNQNCWNNISPNLIFIVSNINEVKGDDFFIQRINRNRINKGKVVKNLIDMINYLNEFSNNIYDINLYIYKSTNHQTIIDVRYFLKSDLDSDYLKTVINNPPMLHSKLTRPPYVNDKEKFDVNWELGGIRHLWKMFWWEKSIKVKF